MKLGFFGANVGGMVSRQAGEVAAHAEGLGYQSLWVGEHLVLPSPRQPKPPLDPDWPMADPLVTLGYLAAHTERIQLCTGIVAATLRQPVQLAKEAATVDVLSDGRLVLGVGVGYLDLEYQAMGVPADRRRARFREHLHALQALWTMKEPVFHGDFVWFDGIDAHPRPVRPEGPPLVLGGKATVALQDAAEFGSGWYGFGHTPDEAARARAVIFQHAEKIGRDLAGFEITLTPRARLSLELIDQYRAAGVTQLVVSIEADTLDGVRRRLDYNAPGQLGLL
ncbi:TIGR03619 family F420-dependent LLM class oxidoreductase [Parafrankia sp. EUN1f]|uniref:TIGR03619 family F420-dependent LLM class oxidoreductase n=1 Tax=Parafrankia sp. EUN1f TaxID=102897 RepID=UPI0001C47798|nr:TIGR03619 family F420-dependent LLM class oxidoreductase [Parafrankia sp. EUN1f]EFC86819.1 Luciferase-like monooxygenase [Parafrankia sp. EUN1f]